MCTEICTQYVGKYTTAVVLHPYDDIPRTPNPDAQKAHRKIIKP